MFTKQQRQELIAELEEELQSLINERKKLIWIDNRISTLQGLIASAKAFWDEKQIAQQKASLGLISVQALPLIIESKPTISDAVREILTESNKPMHVRELIAGLKKRGFSLSDKNPASSVSLSLKRKSDVFRKVAPNTYDLRRDTEGTAA